jgi:PAS domain S-box-containing protein
MTASDQAEHPQIPLAQDSRPEQDHLLLAAAAESSREAMAVTDPDGQVLYINPAFSRISGFRWDEMIGRDLAALDHDGDGGIPQAEIRQSLERHGRWSGRLVHRHKRGGLYRVECSISPVYALDGCMLGYVYLELDVTERARLETAAQNAAYSNSLMYVFTGLRHEIGNPINSCRSALELLRDKVETWPTGKQVDYIDRALGQLERVSYLLQTLKSFNMYEHPRIGPLELEPFLERLASVAGEDLADRGIGLEIRVAAGAERCRADPRALQQVLLNLLANACEALDGRDQPRVDLTAAPSGDEVRIRVADNGRGIAERDRGAIFEPFFTTKPHGTGLGLVLARRLTAAMDGMLEIQSRPGAGTRADVFLPGGGSGD